jgi:protein-tyrosine phosphatase
LNARSRAALVLSAACAIAAGGIENPTCESIRPGVYRIDYQASSDSGAVEVFASSRPDRFASARPAATFHQPPGEIRIGEGAERIYFQLKPTSGPARVVSIRRLPLEGASNFRDLGGYRAADGRYVRWGLIYRSGHLANLTARDYEYLGKLGIRLVCDVRSESERERSPTNWAGPSPEFLTKPIESSGYDRLAIDNAAQFGSILRRMAAGDLPAVEHCSSGKDRTGVFSAILLTVLGVPRETVVQDYLLSTQYLLAPENIEQTTMDLQRILGLAQRPDEAYVRARMTTKRETLETAFHAIDREYGSFDGYVRNGLKISNAENTKLQERLLEP